MHTLQESPVGDARKAVTADERYRETALRMPTWSHHR